MITTVDEALAVVESKLKSHRLSLLQKQIFRGVWEGQSYTEIASQIGYNPDYVKENGYKLCKLISAGLGKPVNKKNLRSLLQNLTPDPTPAVQRRCNRHQDWGEAPDVSSFIGRESELAQLQQWSLGDGFAAPNGHQCRLLLVTGIGGIGKTTLATRLAEQVQDQFEFLIWRSLRNAPTPEQMLLDWLQFLAPEQLLNQQTSLEISLTKVMAHLHNRRCLLILDNCESILVSGNCSGDYRQGYQGYAELLRRVGSEQHQSCLLLTGRELPRNITSRKESSIKLLTLKGLQPQDGQLVLQNLGVATASDLAYQQLLARYSGNPLALSIVSATIQELFGGDLHLFLEQTPVLFGDVYNLLAEQFNRLSELEKQILHSLAIEREWIALPQLAEAVWPITPQRLILDALLSLQRRSLIEVSHGQFTLQPVVMEFITEQLLEQAEREIQTGELKLLNHHALINTQTRDYIRESQIRVILAPLAAGLRARYPLSKLAQKLQHLLNQLQTDGTPGYAAGNLLNLLRHLDLDLTGYDLSRLQIWQAYLRDINLQRVNLRGSHLERSLFTEKLALITCLAFSPDGQTLATAGTNGAIDLWQVDTGKKLVTLTTAGYVSGVNFSPDGDSLASCHSDLTIKLWHIPTQACRQTYAGHNHYQSKVIFSRDGQKLFSSSLDATLKVWDVRTGECLSTFTGHTRSIWTFDLSPDERMIASGSADQTIKFWDTRTGQCLKTVQGHTDEVHGVVFAPPASSQDDGFLISAGYDRTIKFWDIATGECWRTLQGHTQKIVYLSLDPKGQILATGDENGTIKLWSISTGECLRTLQGHKNTIYSLAFSPCSQLLASSGLDGMIKLWDVTFPEVQPALNAALAPGRHPGQCLKALSGYTSEIYAVAFSSDNQTLACCTMDKLIHLWQVTSGTYLRYLAGHSAAVWSVAFHPDGRNLVSSGLDGTSRVWDLQTGQSRILAAEVFALHQIVFSPDGKLLVSREAKDNIRIWDGMSGKLFKSFSGKLDLFFVAYFSPDSQYLVCNSNHATARLWDIRTGECLQVFQGHADPVNAIAFHPQGERIATGSDDGTIKLWDIATGQCWQTLTGHQGQVLSVAFHPLAGALPGQQLLASGSGDRTLKLWDIHSGDCLQTLVGHEADVGSVTFTSDGQLLASGSHDETVRLWETQTWDCQSILRAPRPYEGMDITGITGLTQAQKATLKLLGAVEN